MSMPRGVGAFVVCIALGLCWPRACAGWTYHGSLYGYNITIPDGWKAIPPDVVQKTIASVRKPGTPDPLVYDAAFQPADHQQWFQYPYLIVQVIPYARAGQPHQINEDQFPQFVRQLTGVDPNKVLEGQINSNARSLFGKLEVGQPQLDKARRRYLMSANMEVARIGPVRSLMVGYFGRESIVQAQFCSKQAEWDQSAAVAQGIVDSVRFDPDRAYSVAEAEAHPTSPSIWSGVGEKALIGGIIGGCCGLVGYLATRLKKSRSGASGPPPVP